MVARFFSLPQTVRRAPVTLCLLACLLPCATHADIFHKKANTAAKPDSLDAYLKNARVTAAASAVSTGSLWHVDGLMADLASDDKPRYVGDQLTIQLAEATSSALQGSVQTQRSFNASSGISALFGTNKSTSTLQNLFSPTSTQNLNGKGQTALSTTLNTTFGANVVEVLPGGLLVIEARRDVEVTEQKQTLIVRGIVRRDDVLPSNVVLSTSISHLEVTLIGKGVISDGTRQPNIVIRTLLRILNF